VGPGQGTLSKDRPELQTDPNWWPGEAIEGLREIVEREGAVLIGADPIRSTSESPAGDGGVFLLDNAQD
jgi:hypothetical protein